MATTAKNTKQTPPPKVTNDVTHVTIDRKRQFRLGFGILFMLSGIFTCVSIISYFFSWSADQDKLISGKSLSQFLFHDNSPVANLGGRLGASISHILVYKGAGVASLAIGFAIAGLGLSLIYGKKILPLLLYMRWVSILLLLLAPILSYLFPHVSHPYPLGGALGDTSVDYFNGLLGKAGTGMVLLSGVFFFVFVIIALDIRPMISKMRIKAKNMAESLAAMPMFNSANAEPKSEELQQNLSNLQAEVNSNPEQTEKKNNTTPEIDANRLKEGNENVALVIEDSRSQQEWEMSVVEKAPPLHTATAFTITPDAENPGQFLADEDGEEIQEETIEDENSEIEDENIEEDVDFEDDLTEVDEDTESNDPEFSYIVKQEEISSALKHGAHISIADNQPFAPEETLRNYKYPTLDLLEERPQEAISLDKEELERNKEQIIQTLRSFGIEIKTIKATVGPTVTLYEVVPAEGVRISKIKNLEDDIALNLAALGIRIIAPIPGRGTVGIEVPNTNKHIVSMRALLSSEKFVNNKMSLPIALGKKIDNENYIVDLATMPHLLMAGATGQGKSVGINAILVSLLYKKHPSQLKFVMVDPKKVELSIYRTIEKHFLAKLPNEEESIITDIKKVIYTLKALCDEMDDRYGLLKDAGARNIKEYNEKFIARKLNPNEHKFLPFIVLVIDEFADLIMTAGKEVEMPIARLAQLARAVGIHLIIATQRPSVNVITGTIKANFPARIAFKVSAKVDSRTILDTGGAEQLIGRGDLLISHGSELLRLQCAFVDTPEVEKVVEFIGAQQGYPSAHPLPEPEMDDDDAGNKSFDKKNKDKLFEDCARVVVQTQSGSTSMLQRRFNLGYNRAGRIMDQLEAANIVGPASGSKPREVYFKTESEVEQFLHSLE